MDDVFSFRNRYTLSSLRIVMKIIRDFPCSRTGQWSINSTVPLYVYYAWTCLSLSLGSTVARYLLRGSQLSGGRHSPVTLDTMWSQTATAAIFCCFDDRLTTTPNESHPVALGGCQLNSIDVDQRLAATFIEQRLAGDATII